MKDPVRSLPLMLDVTHLYSDGFRQRNSCEQDINRRRQALSLARKQSNSWSDKLLQGVDRKVGKGYPMSDTVDTLQVVVKHQYELEADRADLVFSVKGSSWFTGRAAFEKAKELSRFVGDLKAVGINDEQIELRNVRVEVSSGIFSRTSSAHYTILVRCRQLDRLDEILTAATSQKNASLDNVQWGYPDQSQEDLERLDELLGKATLKAQRMAKALGVKLCGVHSLVEKSHDSEGGFDLNSQSNYEYATLAGSARMRVDTGMEVTHRKTMTCQITVHYKLAST